MELFVKFKVAESSDPFCDPEDPLQTKAGDFRFKNELDNARVLYGQLASYATAHMGRQFRIHVFCILVCGKYARFIRWDRDGTTITQCFDYIKEPTFSLASFGVANILIVASKVTTLPSHQ
ncbi:hypothetical protein PILCRDRAFT_16761 [Piloderma croceum F 1598]|uniref:Fungal-type protein kinase domain-containing protein n=1 Tax=Piloderma croceum (strain F 1598) TaxID=765440 RepID=A0A0C3B390_PILCF|nr:hypothetical protein PILCRDRAFT_16761 [Piloderma croceum F 1598]